MKGRYAVMAVVELATMRARRPVPLAEIAERQNISLSYLEQIFSKLKKAGIVESVRGPGGGYMLAGATGSVSIADIVGAVEGQGGGKQCDPSAPGACKATEGKCRTHDLWELVNRQVHLALSAISLSDVCEGRINVDPLETVPAFGDD